MYAVLGGRHFPCGGFPRLTRKILWLRQCASCGQRERGKDKGLFPNVTCFYYGAVGLWNEKKLEARLRHKLFLFFLQFGRGLSAVLRTGENGRGLSIFDGACLFIRFDFFAGFFLRLFRRTGAAFSEKFFHFRYYWYFVVAFA